MLQTESFRELNWTSPELFLIQPDAFTAFYPAKEERSDLAEAIGLIDGENIELAFGYGSAFSGVAEKDSLMDIFIIVRDCLSFYTRAAQCEQIRLGTINSPTFHTLWNKYKANFYLGRVNLADSIQDIKLGVIGHDEFLKHARGGRKEAEKGKGYLYLAGRLHKAMLVPIFDNRTPKEQEEIDLAINQARIDAGYLTIALMPHYFRYSQFAEQYVDLSYYGR